MQQLSLFDISFEDSTQPQNLGAITSETVENDNSITKEVKPLKTALEPGKPHRDISVQPDGKILYRVPGLGWFSRWSLAIENGHVKVKELPEYYPEESDPFLIY